MNPKVVLAIVLALGFGGCAVIPTKQTQWTEHLLTAAGFHVELAGTAGELAHLPTLKARKVVQDERDGAKRYVYAHPEVCACLDVGDDEKYQKYQRLRIQKGIAEEQESTMVYQAVGPGPDRSERARPVAAQLMTARGGRPISRVHSPNHSITSRWSGMPWARRCSTSSASERPG